MAALARGMRCRRGRLWRRAGEPPRSGGAAGRGTRAAGDAARAAGRRARSVGGRRRRAGSGSAGPRDPVGRRAPGRGRRPARGCASHDAGAADGACGGGGAAGCAATEILQRHVPGLSCSAVAIADGRRAAMARHHRAAASRAGLSLDRQRDAPAAARRQSTTSSTANWRAVCAEVAARFGVRGAFGVDAIWDGRHAWVLEVNPRPSAALELFGPGSFEAHVRGARGVGLPTPGSPPATRCAEGEARAVRRT